MGIPCKKGCVNFFSNFPTELKHQIITNHSHVENRKILDCVKFCEENFTNFTNKNGIFYNSDNKFGYKSYN